MTPSLGYGGRALPCLALRGPSIRQHNLRLHGSPSSRLDLNLTRDGFLRKSSRITEGLQVDLQGSPRGYTTLSVPSTGIGVFRIRSFSGPVCDSI